MAAFAAFFLSAGANAADINSILDAAADSATQAISAELQKSAIVVLSSLVMIQYIITISGALKSGAEIERLITAKLGGSIMWFAFCFYAVMSGPEFIDDLSKFFYGVAEKIAGTPIDAFAVWKKGIVLQNNLVVAFNSATGTDSANPVAAAFSAVKSIFPAIFMFSVCAIILIAAGTVAFSILLAKIELMVMIATSPFSFAFLGLDALRDQGIAPLKYVIALGYRILILGVVVKVMAVVATQITTVFKAIADNPTDNPTSIWVPVLSALFGYIICGVFAFQAKSIAGSLASGQTQLGAGEVAAAGGVIQMAAAGMAGAAAAMAGAATSMAGSASKMAAGSAGAAGNALGNAMNNRLSMSPASGGDGKMGGPMPSPGQKDGGNDAPDGGSSGESASSNDPFAAESSSTGGSNSSGGSSSASSSPSSSGNGSSASIGGQQESKMDKLDNKMAAARERAKQLGQSGLGAMDGLRDVDQGAVGVSINSHAGQD